VDQHMKSPRRPHVASETFQDMTGAPVRRLRGDDGNHDGPARRVSGKLLIITTIILCGVHTADGGDEWRSDVEQSAGRTNVCSSLPDAPAHRPLGEDGMRADEGRMGGVDALAWGSSSSGG
jgi:hypothetical protein